MDSCLRDLYQSNNNEMYQLTGKSEARQIHRCHSNCYGFALTQIVDGTRTTRRSLRSAVVARRHFIVLDSAKLRIGRFTSSHASRRRNKCF